MTYTYKTDKTVKTDKEKFTIDDLNVFNSILPKHISLLHLSTKVKLKKPNRNVNNVHNFESFIPNHLNLDNMIRKAKSQK